MKIAHRLSLLGALAVTTLSVATWAAPMQWSDLTSRPRPEPTTRLPYGKGPLQFAELWLPAGQGPFPVVLMVHGGCWRTDVADLSLMNWAAEDLRNRGIAVWNIEYRGIDRPGGGYPGTYQDVGAATDLLRQLAPLFRLKADHVVIVGHSAGAHLGLWIAGRSGIPANSPLHANRPLPIASVIGLGSVPDLEAEQNMPDRPCDLSASAKVMSGPKTPTRTDRFRDTSPPAMGRFPAKQILVSTSEDRISPPSISAAYSRKVALNGLKPTLVTVPGEGHVELIAPGSEAWNETVTLIERELGVAKPK
ncbi:hypothetical protein ACFB49_16460 [Sphingomonas sp. DBB INV C78]|uniref:alpha/beta hydrolase family protein n=1 Tax=Sphingomonas sp. DBB INV C78 TaxID=3349434 RepID=UPI0036D3A022